MNSIEKQVAELESELRAMKASYQVNGSRIKMVKQISQAWHYVDGHSYAPPIFVKFTPDVVPKDGLTLTTLYVQSSYIDTTFTQPCEKTNSLNLPQTGDGSVIIKIYIGHTPFAGTDYYVRVIAVGPSTGTFTLL